MALDKEKMIGKVNADILDANNCKWDEIFKPSFDEKEDLLSILYQKHLIFENILNWISSDNDIPDILAQKKFFNDHNWIFLETYKEPITKMKNNITMLSNKLKDTEALLTFSEDNNQKIKEEYTTLTHQKSALENQVGTLEREKSAFEEEKKTLAGQKSFLETTNATLTLQNKALEEENKTLARQKKALEEEQKTLAGQKSALNPNQNAHDQNKITPVAQNKPNDKNDETESKKKIEELEKEIVQLKLRLDSKNKEKKSLIQPTQPTYSNNSGMTKDEEIKILELRDNLILFKILDYIEKSNNK